MNSSEDVELARTGGTNVDDASDAVPNDLERGTAQANGPPVGSLRDGRYVLRCFDTTADGDYQTVEGQWRARDLIHLKETSPKGHIRLVLAQHDGIWVGSILDNHHYFPVPLLSLLHYISLFPPEFDVASLEECWDRPHFRHFLRAPSTGFASFRHCVSVIHVIDDTSLPFEESAAPHAMMISWIPCGDDRLMSESVTCLSNSNFSLTMM